MLKNSSQGASHFFFHKRDLGLALCDSLLSLPEDCPGVGFKPVDPLMEIHQMELEILEGAVMDEAEDFLCFSLEEVFLMMNHPFF